MAGLSPKIDHLSHPGLRGNRALNAALRGVTAAVVGVVLNLAVWFSLHTLFGELRSLEFGAAGLSIPVLTTLDWRAAVSPHRPSPGCRL